ncbi:MAG TPA: prepilin-type N-terminal cleavage/methylation domain-containing protein [Usitatibacter sp.]|nr:prepilin-type N-terminal cleavage/methylation domain-containing protein [Usitatibacter sp.]
MTRCRARPSRTAPPARSQAGFTLVEVVLAMVLLATMMLLLYSGLSFALRSWDAADVGGRAVADRRIGENFLRRELTEVFPMRWKDPTTVKVAFTGEPERLRFVSTRPVGASLGGLSLVGVEVEGDARRDGRHLVMRRSLPDDEAKDFGPLERSSEKPSILVEDVASVTFSYFGAESDFGEPKWMDAWTFPGRIPQMIRMRVKSADGTMLPEMVAKVMLGEEAGCLENSFQRMCRPRRSP